MNYYRQSKPCYLNVYGRTGAGKSYFLNKLFGVNYF
jgi:predicted GTPase